MEQESHYMNIRIEKSTGKWEVYFTDEEGNQIKEPKEVRNISPKEAHKAIAIDENIKYIDRATWYTYETEGARSLWGCVWIDSTIR